MTDEEIEAAFGKIEVMLAEIADLIGQIRSARAPDPQPWAGKLPPAQRVPGYNVDRVNVAAGLAQAVLFGYTGPESRMLVEYALMRHAKGEEDGAQKTALGGGISLTAWYAILAAAITTAEQEARS